MDPCRTYEYLTQARRTVLDHLGSIDPTILVRPFGFGVRTIDRTLVHVMISEWYYVQRLQRRDVPPYAEWPVRDETPLSFAALDSLWESQAAETRRVLADIPDWGAPIEYRVTDDDGRRLHVTTTTGDLMTQLALHEVHHRAQIMSMLRLADAPIEDLDFNALMFDRRPATDAPPTGSP